MKEMCNNFVCNGCNRCNTCGVMPANAAPDAMMGDCNTCVMERVGPAQAFVPAQPWQMPMPEKQSLVCGTVFSDLVMPYCAGWNLYRFRKEV